MRKSWKIFRAIVSVLLLFAVVVPSALYVLLSFDSVQDRMRTVAQDELSKLLGAEIAIGKVYLKPFNQIAINDVSLVLNGDTIAAVDEARAGLELYALLHNRRLEIDYALIDGFDGHLWRIDKDSPLNIQPIIDHLKTDKPSEQKIFDLKINTVILRNSSFSYDVLTAAPVDSNKFDSNHIRVKSLGLNAYIPQLSNDAYRVHLKHLSFVEQSGFELSNLRFNALVCDKMISLDKFTLDLPLTHLAFKPIFLTIDGFDNIKESLLSSSVHLATDGDCSIYLPDAKAFVPAFAAIDVPWRFALSADGSAKSIALHHLSIDENTGRNLSLALSAKASTPDSIRNIEYDILGGHLNLNGAGILALLPPNLKKSLKNLDRIPQLHFGISGKGNIYSGHTTLVADGSAGKLNIDGSYTSLNNIYSVNGNIIASELNLRTFTGNNHLGLVNADIAASATLGKRISADIDGRINNIDLNGYSIKDIELKAWTNEAGQSELNFNVHDPAAQIMAYALLSNSDTKHLSATATISSLDLFALGLDKKHKDYKLFGKINANLDGTNIDNISGQLSLSDLRWTNDKGLGAKLSRFAIELQPEAATPFIDIKSDILSGKIEGPYSFSSIAADSRELASAIMPALVEEPKGEQAASLRPRTQKGEQAASLRPRENNFKFEIKLLPSQELTEFIGLPIHIMDNVEIDGAFNSTTGQAMLTLDAPYLLQNNNLLETTLLHASADRSKQLASVYVASQFPTKKGDMALAGLIRAENNDLKAHVDWNIERDIPIGGAIDISAFLRDKVSAKNPDDITGIDALININPGSINFGDDTWQIRRSFIEITPKNIVVDNFRLQTPEQKISIDGTLSHSDADSLTVALEKVHILPIFETLQIDKAYIGGSATGKVTAKNVFSSEPYLHCNNLHVDSIGYQHCTIGNADILAGWDNEKKSVFLDADITGLEGKKSRIFGDIIPSPGALDLSFDVDSVPVGFLKPFLSAFSSDISGRASGFCRLFGTFSEVDLVGDVDADNVKLKIDFLGTSFIASDSVHMRPGKIVLDNIAVRDPEGHTARLNGVVNHTYFKDPMDYRFDITDVHNMLCFKTSAYDNPDWYGTIYGNGHASISGKTGQTNIDVAMSTAPGSTFTFVLSDRLDAEDYSFLTFRDVTPDSLRNIDVQVDLTPDAVKAFRKKISGQTNSSSEYNMDLQIGITRDANITLVMDPAAGDEIRAHGAGNVHLAYLSRNNDLNIWGKYVLSDGTYRFTLQDIIIKDFTIKEGSEIQFDGDPTAVKTKLQAYYATNANLTDLDESFRQDKDVARTNVPVHALMFVSGDIRQPSVDFDLEFPTMTSDTYRKVRSIVSTTDMMNRQIIYLLALNRFYTPDYMASTTKGSELFSVASSTISSQLSSMLGKLSDNWSIAPNLRSDRGDFSDVEVDLALSSRLLNNRLIFNGNFGYRDKSLNTNQFVGDFDLEYLLNKSGTWRLKAYNRYNDRNFYVRSSPTTQGVGIMFRRDFDSLLSFMRRKNKAMDSPLNQQVNPRSSH